MRPTPFPAWSVILTVGAVLCVAVVACGGSIDIPSPSPTGEQEGLRGTGSPSQDSPTQTAGGSTSQSGTVLEDIVLLDEHWYSRLDELGRPSVRWNAIASNEGAIPVTVSIRIEVFDQEGRLVGEGPFQRRSEEIVPGGMSPFSIGAGPLDAEATRVEALVEIRQIPDFRRERYGRAVFEGEVLATSFEEDRREVRVVATVAVRNTGDSGSSVFPRLAVYDAGGVLVAGGLGQGSLPNLCPGESDELDVQMSFSVPEGFDPTTAEVRVFFNYPEVAGDLANMPTPVGGTCE